MFLFHVYMFIHISKRIILMLASICLWYNFCISLLFFFSWMCRGFGKQGFQCQSEYSSNRKTNRWFGFCFRWVFTIFCCCYFFFLGFVSHIWSNKNIPIFFFILLFHIVWWYLAYMNPKSKSWPWFREILLSTVASHSLALASHIQ